MGRRRRRIDWRRRSSGALEARRSVLFSQPQSCNSKSIRAPQGLCSRDQVRAAPSRYLFFASLFSHVAARRKLLMLIQIADDALRGSSWSGAAWSICVRYARWLATLAFSVPFGVRDL